MRRILRDRDRVASSFRGVMKAIAEGICDPDFKMGTAWERAGLSPRHTSDLGRDLGIQPSEYLRRRRLEIAALLLLEPSCAEEHLAVIAESAGFEYKTFGENFPKWSGQTPSDFRANPGAEIVERLRRLQQDDEVDPVPAAPAERSRLHTALFAEVAASMAHEKLIRARRAAVTGRFEAALDWLPQVLDDAAEHELDELASTAHAYLGYALHQRAAEHVDHRRLDDAYADLAEARDQYRAAGRLPPCLPRYRRRIAVPHDPRSPLLDALCRRCRPRLLGDAGSGVRHALGRALVPVDRDLPWFHDACDRCYRVVWDAVSKARLGLLDDAWQATWLVHFCDPHEPAAPPSIGRFVALLHASEAITFGDQGERAEICRQAVDVAVGLGDPVREALARVHYGNALRATGRHDDAAKELEKTKKTCRDVPWVRAFYCFVAGSLDYQRGQSDVASATLDEAFGQYEDLDPHMAGMVRMLAGDVHCSNQRYTEALEAYDTCESLIDDRRAPLMLQAAIPINLAAAYCGLSDWDEAEAALARCDYNRAKNRSLLAVERFNGACVALGMGQSRDALSAFAEARALCEHLGRWLDAGLVALYTVEAYMSVNERLRAIESCTEALRIFRKLGCDRKTEESLVQLGNLLKPMTVDLAAVVACVRQLARYHGGSLPVPSS